MVGPRKARAIALHSICHPGRPLPHGASQETCVERRGIDPEREGRPPVVPDASYVSIGVFLRLPKREILRIPLLVLLRPFADPATFTGSILDAFHAEARQLPCSDRDGISRAVHLPTEGRRDSPYRSPSASALRSTRSLSPWRRHSPDR
eukprot:scaffold304_cov248-Pinguiococcus_pyrenoidosus.AAC.3